MAAASEGEALAVIAPRRGNQAGCGWPLPLQPVDIDEPAAHLEGAGRCVVLVLDDDAGAEPLRQLRPDMRRRRRHRFAYDFVRALQLTEIKHLKAPSHQRLAAGE